MSEKQKVTPSRNRPMGGPRGLGQPAEKPQNFKATFVKLLKYVKPHAPSMIIVIVFSIIGTSFSVFGPRKLGEATTILITGMMAKLQGVPGATVDFPAIRSVLLFTLMLYVFSATINFLQQIIMTKISQKIVFNLREDVDTKLKKLPLKYFDTNSLGDILSRVTNDIDTISTTFQQSLTQLISAAVTLIGVIGMMITIDWGLTLLTMLIIPLSLVITIFIAKFSQKYFVRQQTLLGNLNGHIEESYSGQNIVKAFGQEEKFISEFDEHNDALFETAWKANFFSGIMMPLLSFVGSIGYIIVAVAGAIFSINYGLSVGDIQAFLQYSQQFTQPIIQTAQIANIFQSSIAAAERVFELLEEAEEMVITNPQTIPNEHGAVTLTNVNFGYNEDQMIINDFSVEVKQGQTVAIVGPTGAGKTTIINLLMRFYDANSGSILIDGVDISMMERSYLRRLFGMVLQDTWLFSGSIYDNIAYGNENATKEQVIAAAKAANVDHFIRTLQDGYDTVINEDATNISQGQKQLLTIARAILADPLIMILDEATSSVDTRTEILIQKAMDELMVGRTSFVIAHRLSTIKNADVILVMRDGRIVEQGSHKKLLEQNGFYAELYNSQFSESE
jgi:ABC-type multidrug transport system, ATPase and permease components